MHGTQFDIPLRNHTYVHQGEETKSDLWRTIPAKIHGLNFKFII